ncbi:serine carboxypeptidase-like 7 isoform X1 [Phalaenopsis equestris]|uniref:serine carboxypeptidase-like 7 isoform X1 n=1 Tax=Phalaenopsis equestris TaxID=78828 RepID=UPI0009E22BBC|nr:serine carboxypeptidase-like 7 isoform X1 [Phalaenopsis equestris]
MSTTFILLQILSVFFCNFCLFPYYCNALHASRITHLPGFNGSLPFYLETGYVTVNEESGAELFYYFVESERNPSDDPLILFLVGGPYCSGFSGLALDVGPLGFMVKAYDGTLPTLTSNPFSWTQISSIIFLDWPVGTGFSFSPSIVDYHTDEVKSAKQIYKFLIKWLLDHPSFQSNPFYVAGDSYGGKMAPLSALEIADGNENFRQPFVNLKGYLVGNPVTSDRIDISSQPPHAYGLGIISDELLKLIQINCVGEDYRNPKNTHCATNLKTLNEFLSEINKYSILEPKCPDDSFELKEQKGNHRSIKEKFFEFYPSLYVPDIDCANDRLLSYYWSNDRLTKVALHIKEGTVEEWHRCKQDSNNYTYNVPTSVPHHLNLIRRGYRALIYSGDHDLDIPFIGTLKWVRSLNFSIVENWRSWRAGGQVAGYTILFSNNLTFATVKGGSHTAPNNMPLQCFVMFERWISHKSL